MKQRRKKPRPGRRFTAMRPCSQVSPSQTFLKAAAIGSITAIEDYPNDVMSPDEQRIVAHLAVTMAPSGRKTSLFIETFCMAYQQRLAEYQADAGAHDRDVQALRKVGATELARCFIADGRKAG